MRSAPQIAACLAALFMTCQTFAADALKSALDGNAPPYAMPRLDGSVEGLSVDMTAEIAKRLGRPITLDKLPFTNLIPAFQAGAYDMLSVPLMVTEERAQSFAFTEGLWSADLQFLQPRSKPRITDFSQLRGQIIATNKGNAYDRWARDKAGEYGWNVESYGSLNEAALAVQAGRAAAALVDTATGLTIAKRLPTLQLSELKIATGKFYSYAVSTRDPGLRNQIEQAIECIKRDGTAAKLYEKWLGVTPPAGSLEVTPQPGVGPVGFAHYDPTPLPSTCQ
ncbi:transporter substrate-binding domain-containing protein [uncultured Pseudomonas sp.]|uniref:transporter substrate-binding domain-containing protein n=1 Tax=uncultured Pseudomonas sp. TaxID=114707 RepID=UPI0025E47D93|nr:transporter substrate-binding domain-containing protein [uncultured Pseudomonas sp.]